jgi:hypothetical protein
MYCWPFGHTINKIQGRGDAADLSAVTKIGEFERELFHLIVLLHGARCPCSGGPASVSTWSC